MGQDRKLTRDLWYWLKGLTANGKALTNEAIHDPCRPRPPVLRFFPAQFPAPVVSPEPGYVMVYCADLEIGVCLAEAINRYGRDVYICDDLDDTLELVSTASDVFHCVLFAETLPGGDEDLWRMVDDCSHGRPFRWMSLQVPISCQSGPSETACRETQIAALERAYLDCCQAFEIGRHSIRDQSRSR